MTGDPHDLAAVYVLDALDPDERRQFERHLETCAHCRDEVADLELSAAELADLVSEPVPVGLRHQVLAEISHTSQVAAPVGATAAAVVPLSAARSLQRRPWLLAMAAAVIVAVAGLTSVLALRPERSSDDVAAVLASPDARHLHLDPSAPILGQVQEGTTVDVVWSPSRNQVVVEAQGLPDPGAGHRYQLWRLEPDGAAPSALFGPDAQVAAPLDGEPTGWGVTVEPESGSPQPTSPVVYRGNV